MPKKKPYHRILSNLETDIKRMNDLINYDDGRRDFLDQLRSGEIDILEGHPETHEVVSVDAMDEFIEMGEKKCLSVTGLKDQFKQIFSRSKPQVASIEHARQKRRINEC